MQPGLDVASAYLDGEVLPRGSRPGENRPDFVSAARRRDATLTFTGDDEPVLGTFPACIAYATP